MEVTKWNQNQIQDQFKNCKNLGDLIQNIEFVFNQKGQLICEIAVNGQTLTEKDEQEMKDYDFKLINEISVKSNTQEGLAKESQQSVSDLLIEIEKELIISSEFFRMAELHGRGQELFDKAIKNSQVAIDLTTYMVHISSNQDVKREWQSIRAKFLSLSHQVHGAFKTKDYILLADLLEYEYSNLLQSWKSWISACKL